MEKNIFSKNFNPPQINVGQIWSTDKNYLFLILKNINADYVEGVILLPETERTHDDKSINITIDGFKIPRTIMRMSKGPIRKRNLYVYVDTVNNETIEKIQVCIKNEDYSNFNKWQLELFDEILENLHQIRIKI